MKDRVAKLRAWISRDANDLPQILRMLGTEYRDVLEYAKGAITRRRDSIHVALDGVRNWGAVEWSLQQGLPAPRPWALTVTEGPSTIWAMLYDDADAVVWDVVTLAVAWGRAEVPAAARGDA